MSILTVERDKYATLWDIPAYRDVTGGHRLYERLAEEGSFIPGRTVLDIGCGPGTLAKSAAEDGMHPTLIDFVDARNADVKQYPFLCQSVWEPIEGHWDYGLCADVMEHIPEQFTMLAIRNMLDACSNVWFNIATVPDHGGRLIGETLHVTVQPYTWWKESIEEIGEILDARHMIVQGMFHVRRRSS
jgi:2-polyprenyl-3-methyl-5-hydroxy-6-metoxy-1,4-benzoquinol methylase